MDQLKFKISKKWYEIKKKIMMSLLFILSFIISGTPAFGQGLLENNYEEIIYNVGLKIVDFEYEHLDGEIETVTTAIWYPTEESQQTFTYDAERSYESIVALNAPIAKKEAPYPLIIFAHGAYGSGYNSAFFLEYLASHGYIAVAPDYVDTQPPDYTEQIAFSRIRGGNVGRSLQILRIVKQFVNDMGGDRDFFLEYLEKYRLNHTSFIIDEIIKMNKTRDSILYQTVKEDAIGISGHSEGGLTVLGKIEAHVNKKFKDDRIKAALIFSAPAYPFEKTAHAIDIPVMFMVGDNDAPTLHPELTRRTIYDEVRFPKFYLVLRDSNHFAFGNRGCGQTTLLYQCVENNPQSNAIARYGLAFFDKYLRGNLSANEQLERFDPALVYYTKEETEGIFTEWGNEPDSRQGAQGGIKEELRNEIRERLRERRGGKGRFGRW